ncbi:MAG TPA: methyltransferase domain-containing protein [Acidimicrobiales bacterium]|nr:methyltransferase domain-containing protein [Acidimicrobiales bacterium]
MRTVERVGLREGERVLDVPCGTGPALLPAAQRVGPTGQVVGLDVAERMLAIAREKVGRSTLTNVSVHYGDMTALDVPATPYDAVLCVLGIFFVDDMPGVVRSFLDLVRPRGGRVAVTVFGENVFEPVRSVFVEAVNDVMPGLEVVQAWNRTARLDAFRRVFEDAGVGAVSIETDDDAVPMRSAGDWWRIVMGSGLRRAVGQLGPERAAEVRARCERYVEQHRVDRLLNRSRYAIVVRD